MVSKTVMCPKCKQQVTITGNPGEKVTLTCQNCNLIGNFIFPDITVDTSSFCIEIKNLTKRFKDVNAVDDLSFKVRKGEIFGFLGPNGAGKTTTIKALIGLIHVNSGYIKINGLSIDGDSIAARKNIGFLPERVAFYDNLTPLQTLHFFCELRGVDKSGTIQLLKDVGLEDAINRKVGTFSKGMIQLLGIAQLLIGNPSVFILDEPMSGLDARWAKIVRDKIKMLNERGATIFFSSHNMAEVQNLCDRVGIINKGKLIAEDTVTNLSKYLHMKPHLEITIKGLNGKIPKIINNFTGVEDVKAKGDILFITSESHIHAKIISSLQEAGFIIDNIKTIEPSLEDTFIKLIEGDN